MKEITAYRTTDGQLFTDERKAEAHQQDIIGEALDNLIANDTRGNITRADRYNMLTETMSDPDFKAKVSALFASLDD